MKKICKTNSRKGFISIEIIIIASLCLIAAFSGIGHMVNNGQEVHKNTTEKVDEAISVANGEFIPNEEPDIEIPKEEPKEENPKEEAPEEEKPEVEVPKEDPVPEEEEWVYNETVLPPLPDALKDYSWNAIGTSSGLDYAIGASRAPVYSYEYGSGKFTWNDISTKSLKYELYFLIGNNWVKRGSFNSANNPSLKTTDMLVTNSTWSNLDLYYSNGLLYLEGTEPVLKQ